MKKTMLFVGVATLALLVGCEDKKQTASTTPTPKESVATQTKQNILDYTKILKLDETVEITDPQNYTQGTIEYSVWTFITLMDSGKYKDCLSLLVPGEYDELALKMWYDASFSGNRWDLDKNKSFTLKDFNGSYNCIFEGFSNKNNKNRKASYYIIVKDGKVWLTGKNNVKTF